MRSVAALLLCCGALLAQDLATVEAAIGKRMAATIPFYLEWTEQLVDRGAVVRETRGRIAYDRKRSATWKVEDTTGRPWHRFQLWDGTHSIELYVDGNGWSGSSRPDTIGSGPRGVVLFGLDLGTYANLGRSRFLGRETLGGFACEVWEREEWPRNRPVRRWLAVEHG